MIRWSKIFRFFIAPQTLFFIALFFIAFFIRLKLAGLAYPDPIFDQDRYVTLARDFLDGKLIAECCDKPAGYPIFIALILDIFGRTNLNAVRFLQILLDVATVYFIYRIAKDIFGNFSAYAASFLYAINPFTSSYVGLLLPEILDIFLIMLILFLITRKAFARSVPLWVFYGLSVGLLVLTRKQLVTISLLQGIYILFFVIKQKSAKVQFVIVALVSFFITSFYSLYANYVTFNKISLFPPYLFSGNIYLLNYSLKPFPELLLTGQDFEPIYYQIGRDWYGVPLSERSEVNKKYAELFRSALQANFPAIVRNYFSHMFMIWDHDHLFYYADIWYPKDRAGIRLINWSYIGFAVLGLFIWSIEYIKKLSKSSVFVFSIIHLAIVTFLFTLYSYEPRHSLVSWGFISLWAGQGIILLTEKLLKRRLTAGS